MNPMTAVVIVPVDTVKNFSRLTRGYSCQIISHQWYVEPVAPARASKTSLIVVLNVTAIIIHYDSNFWLFWFHFWSYKGKDKDWRPHPSFPPWGKWRGFQISPLSWEDETCWIWLLVSSQSFQVFWCRIYSQARRNGSNTYLIPENHQYRVNHDGNLQLSSYWYDHTVVLARLIMALFIVRTRPHNSEIGNHASR